MYVSGASPLFRWARWPAADGHALVTWCRRATMLASAPALAALLLALAAGRPIFVSIALSLISALVTFLLLAILRSFARPAGAAAELHALGLERRASALRRFWRASADFEGAGWARRDLETLRLLCLNISPDVDIGLKMRGRLRSVISRTLAGAVDRLAELSIAAKDAELGAPLCAAIESDLAVLSSHLERAHESAGLTLPDAAAEIALRVSGLLEASDMLRDRVRPRILADLGPMLRWVIGSRFAEEAGSGRLAAEIDAAHRVAVRPLDLAHALNGVLRRILDRGQLNGELRLRIEDRGPRVVLEFEWSVRDRWHIDPAILLDELRPLESYGAIFGFREQPRDRRMVIELDLPAAPPRPAAGRQPGLAQTGSD